MAIDKWEWFKTIGYNPHQGQLRYHQSQARFRVPSCGRRFGKSLMVAKDLEPKLFQPNKRFWAVGPTYDLGEKEFRVVWNDLIVGQQLGRDKRVQKRYSLRGGDMYIEFPWQTRFQVRSAQHPEDLVGEALDGLIVSEAAKHNKETWERYLRPSLADKRGFADFPSTPEGHNFYYDLWKYGQNPDLPDYESWKGPSWENRAVYPGGRNDPEILLLEKTTTPEWFMQEIGADFASFVGKIYGEWDESVHVKRVPYNPTLPNYIAFDWGYTAPLAAVEFQIGPFDDVYIWREHYKSFTPLQEHVEEMRNREQPPGYAIECCFGDAEDPAAAEYVSMNFAPCVAMPEAKKNWRQGIEVVKRYLKSYEIGELDEYGTPLLMPKLFVDHSCSNLIREFNLYRAKQSRTGLTPRDVAEKVDDHALDALRYGLMHVFELGARRHLSEIYTQASFGDSEGNKDQGYFTTTGMQF